MLNQAISPVGFRPRKGNKFEIRGHARKKPSKTQKQVAENQGWSGEETLTPEEAQQMDPWYLDYLQQHGLEDTEGTDIY